MLYPDKIGILIFIILGPFLRSLFLKLVSSCQTYGTDFALFALPCFCHAFTTRTRISDLFAALYFHRFWELGSLLH